MLMALSVMVNVCVDGSDTECDGYSNVHVLIAV